MDKCLKQIIWMSWTLRSRALFLNCIKKSRITYNTSQNYWNSNKDIYRSVKLEPLKKIMEESLSMTSNDTKRILDSINNECHSLDLHDMLNVLGIIARIVSDEKKGFDLKDHEGFKFLCNQMQVQVRYMSTPEVLKSIKLLNFLNVPSNTMLMQSLLQMIRSNINQLDINQIHLLISIFKKMQETPLSSALLIALPLLFENVLMTKLDYSDLKELALALYYVKYVDKSELVIKIYKNIQSLLVNDSKPASASTLKNIYISLSMLSSKKPFAGDNRRTIEMVREALFQNINKLTPVDILECIKEISRCMVDKQISYSYDVTFINELLNVLITKDVNFKTCCDIAKYLNNITFIYLPFIEFVTNKLSNEEFLEQMDSYRFVDILQLLSNAEYQSVPWLHVENKLLEDTFFNEYPAHILLKSSVHLAVLNKFYPKVLAKVFTKTDSKLLALYLGNNIHYKRFLFLYQTVKSLYPHYNGPWPGKLMNENTGRKFDNKLRPNLEKIMGGPHYVMSNLKTKLGHDIDHAVVFRRGGYPIAFNTNNSDIIANNTYFVEDMRCEPNTVVVLIMEYSSLSYSINTKQLLGVWKLQLKSIEKWTGHRCVPINLKKWSNLPKYEQNSYIMEEIKDKCSEILEIT